MSASAGAGFIGDPLEEIVKASSLGLAYYQIQNELQFHSLQLYKIWKKGIFLWGSHENKNIVFGTSQDNQ
jgi:hypothetical protein